MKILDYRNLIFAAISQSLYQNDYSMLKIQPLSKRLNISLNEAENLIGYLLELTRRCMLWVSHSETELKQNLIEIGLKDEYVGSISKSIIGVTENTIQVASYVNQLEKLTWRIDISLCYR